MAVVAVVYVVKVAESGLLQNSHVERLAFVAIRCV